MEILQTPFSCQRGNLTIRGIAFGDTQPGRHAVILSHGFLGDQGTVRDYALILAGDGFLAVTFDFSGGGPHSTSDGKTEDMTVLTEKEDLMAVIREVQTRYQPASLSLMGGSQGGFVSALTARALGAGTIRSLMLFFPAFCIPDDARRGQLMFFRFDPDHVPELLGSKPMKLGGEYARAVMNMDPYAEISGYAGPVLLIHGTADDIVDIRYARKAKEYYNDCEYHEIEGGGHGFSGEHEEEARRLLRAFMKRTVTD